MRKNSSYNPYTKSKLYDWDFKLKIDDFTFTDSYRGFNPYSGVEYVYEKDNNIPVWSCDYVGYVNQDAKVSSEEIYKFLKEARGNNAIKSGYRTAWVEMASVDINDAMKMIGEHPLNK